jgi:hypothetical protein
MFCSCFVSRKKQAREDHGHLGIISTTQHLANLCQPENAQVNFLKMSEGPLTSWIKNGMETYGRRESSMKARVAE